MVNEYFEINNYGHSLYYYIFELANFCVLASLLLFLYKLKYINVNSLIVWTFLFISPLFFNYFIFSPWFFPDQFQYAGEIASIKSKGESISNIAAQGKSSYGDLEGLFAISAVNPVTFATSILGLAPLPNYMTVTSLAFANKLFLFLTFLWLKRDFQNENILLIFFLIPSLILYSSLSLRDNLIIILSILFLFNILKNRYLVALVILYPIFFLKIQMATFFALYFIGRLFFRAHIDKSYLAIFGATILIISFVYQEMLLAVINTYRYGFAAEDLDMGNGFYGYAAWGMYGDEIKESITLSSIPETIFKSLLGLPALLLMPLPWNWTNIFYPIQALESIF